MPFSYLTRSHTISLAQATERASTLYVEDTYSLAVMLRNYRASRNASPASKLMRREIKRELRSRMTELRQVTRTAAWQA